MAYRALDRTQIIGTLQHLSERIDQRFPGSGLAAVAREFLALGKFCADESDDISRPHWPIRIGTAVLIVIVIAFAAFLLTQPLTTATPLAFETLSDYLQAVEAAVNEAVFLAVAFWFLGSLEGRLKRRRALAAIHQLRSIAHVVDMHQLTKDPYSVTAEPPAEQTHSGRRLMTQQDLGRYLDHCSEMLSLTTKVAALFVQQSDDPQILAAVDEVSGLTNGLTSKIWQKLTILDAEMIARRTRLAGNA